MCSDGERLVGFPAAIWIECGFLRALVMRRFPMMWKFGFWPLRRMLALNGVKVCIAIPPPLCSTEYGGDQGCAIVGARLVRLCGRRAAIRLGIRRALQAQAGLPDRSGSLRRRKSRVCLLRQVTAPNYMRIRLNG